jgi:hypothetical protein
MNIGLSNAKIEDDEARLKKNTKLVLLYLRKNNVISTFSSLANFFLLD